MSKAFETPQCRYAWASALFVEGTLQRKRDDLATSEIRSLSLPHLPQELAPIHLMFCNAVEGNCRVLLLEVYCETVAQAPS
ncbi:MAG: hypothetical protein KME50_09210 [Nostoc desertorum CM1-VF14]|nr:hypothetical protein [Nostoc desertorum CM1-VF14]